MRIEVDSERFNASSRERRLALLLELSGVLKPYIVSARKKLGNPPLLPYPHDSAEENLIRDLVFLKTKLPNWEAKEEILREKTSRILNLFDLSLNWQLPMEVLILTDTLVVPQPQPTIEFFDPSDLPKGTSTIDRVIEIAPYLWTPALHFMTRPKGKKEIKKWVDENYPMIKKNLTKLPGQKDFKWRSETIVLGAMAYKKMGASPRGGWEKFVEEEINKKPKIEELFNYPSGSDIQKAHATFKESLKKMSPR